MKDQQDTPFWQEYCRLSSLAIEGAPVLSPLITVLGYLMGWELQSYLTCYGGSGEGRDAWERYLYREVDTIPSFQWEH